MQTRLQRWLSPPIFPDEEQTRIAGLLNLLLLAILSLMLLDAALLLIFAPETISTFWINGIVVLITGVLLWLMRRGSVRLAGVILFVTVWPISVAYIAASGGLGSPGLGFLSLFIVIGVTLFGTRGGIALAVLNLLCLAGFYIADISGILVSVEGPPTLSRLVITNSIVFVLLTALVAVSGRSVHDALARARNGERALQERNRELQHEIAERKRGEDILRRNEANLQAILDNSDLSYVLMDADQHVVTVNRVAQFAAQAVFGRNIHSGDSFTEFLSDWNRADFYQNFEVALRGEIALSEQTFATPQVQTRHFHFRYFPAVAPDGQVLGVCLSSQDVTERKQAEVALRKSEERYRLISELISDYAYAYSVAPDNTLAHEWLTEDSFERITGFTSEEIDKRGVFALYHPDDVPAVQKDLEQVLAGLKSGGEFRIITRSGAIRWLRIFRRPVWDVQQSRVVRFYGVAQDITERKEAEEALRKSEERYRVISTMISDYAFCNRLEPDGTIDVEWITESFTRLTGYTSEEMVEREAQHRYALFHPDDQARMDDEMATVLQGKAVANEYRIIRKSGEQRWLRFYRQPVWDEAQQRVVRYYGVAQDITERKHAEEELKRRDAILEAVSTATNAFLKATDWQQEIANVLGILGKASGVDRSSIVELYRDEQGRPFANLRYEWDAAGIPPMLDDPLSQNIDLVDLESGPLMDYIARKQPLYFHVKDRPPTKRALGERTGTKTFLILPILLHSTPWGALLLSVTRKEREWSKPEQEALQIAADMLGTVMERTQTEESLAKERILLRKVIDHLPDNIYVKDRDSRFVLNNAASLATLGLTRQEELLGKSDLDFFPRELAEKWRAEEQAVMQSGQPTLDVEEFQPWHVDKRRWVIGSTIPLPDERGEVFGMLGVSRDITDRKLAEEAIRQSAARLNVLHQIDQAILSAVSADEIAQAVSQQIRRLIPCQYAAIEIIDSETSEYVVLAAGVNGEAPESSGRRYPLTRGWLELFNQGRLYAIPDISSAPESLDILQNLPNKGTGSLVAFPLITHGVLRGCVILMADEPNAFSDAYLEIGREVADQLAIAIEHAQLYELAQRHAVELEQRVQERTEQLEAASRAKSIFLANMNHELRTPLNAILGFTNLLAHQGNPTTEQRENLNIIERSGQHLLDLINDVLDMSRIEAGRVTVDESSFDLHGTIKDVEQLIALRAADKKLHLEMDVTPGVPRYMISDQRKLRQILINLLGNAVKFTDVGSIILRIQYMEAAQASDQPGTLHIEVEDTGRGIAEEEIGKLFQPFSQTESGRTVQQGTGLGLAISRQFVQILGGDITVKSQIGLGTTFTFTIPMKPGIPPITSKSVSPSQRRVVGLAPGQMSYRVLVVDDAEENRLLLCKLLSQIGLEVLEATNGKEAIELHEEWQPHLIFMDMKMPVMDGYEATRRIKASTQGQATAIVALTANPFEETRSIVLSAGCDDYLRKPLVVSELLTKIEQHLGVQFLYEIDEAGDSGSSVRHTEEVVLTQTDFLDLPESWISDLHTLAVMADSNRMLKKIAEIQDEHPRLAKGLTTLVKTFQLETILALTSRSMGQENDDGSRGRAS